MESISPNGTSPRYIAAIVLSALLAGCAAQPSQEPLEEPGWETHSERLAAVTQWSFSGRIVVRTAQGADSARLKWQQRWHDIEMELSGPVGLKRTTLLREGGRLSLLQDGEWQRLDPGQDPLLQSFGWSLPLDYLPWWLKGLPAPLPAPTGRELAEGRLTRLVQAGWTLEYADYQWVDGYPLPRSIRFQREGVEGKILLKNWILVL